MPSPHPINGEDIGKLLHEAAAVISHTDQKDLKEKLNRVAAVLEGVQLEIKTTAGTLAVERARLDCATEQAREAQIRADDRESDRQFLIGGTIAALVLTLLLFVIGGFALVGSQPASKAVAVALIGLAVCWTVLTIFSLTLLDRSRR